MIHYWRYRTVLSLAIICLISKRVSPGLSSATSALLVYSTTFVTKLLTAPTLHVIATLRLFHPKVTEGALFEFLTHSKLLEGLFALFRVFSYLILLTSLILVVDYSAVKTVALGALWTNEFLISVFIKDKSVLTVGCGAPRHISLLRDCLLK